MPRLALFLCFVLFGFQSANAHFFADSTEIEEAMIRKYKDSINATLKYQHGSIELPGTSAKLNLPSRFKFLDKKQSRFVLEDLWGNLPQDEVLGTVFPVDSDPFTAGSYVFVISYENIGYVKDDDVEDIDYDDILKEMKSDGVEENKKRSEAGLATMTLVGWAAKPFYDKANHTLHWAKNLQVEGSDENTLNYTIMLLGRNGILHLNAVASVKDLAAVQASIPEILKMPEFVSGSTYKDFDPGIDKVAAWTIGGLVAGKLLAKAGILVLLLKFWKLIALAFVAIGGFIAKYFKRRKNDQAWPADDYASTVNGQGNDLSEQVSVPGNDSNGTTNADAEQSPVRITETTDESAIAEAGDKNRTS